MPYTPEHKAATRAKIVEHARMMFNRRGFDGISIDEIMAGVGLTRGGFYNHFKSKEELYSEAVASYARRNPSERWKELTFDLDASAEVLAGQLINAYLSPQHLEDLDHHCPVIALSSDVSRAGPVVRRTYQDLVMNMAAIFEAGLGRGNKDARQRALAMTALCIGSMVLARTLDDRALGNEFREAARQLALDATTRAR